MANNQNRFGAWQSWHPRGVAQLFSPQTVPWLIAGGWALDLFLGEQTRNHDDIDVQILRRDQQAVRSLLQEWDIQAVIHPAAHPDSWPFHTWEPDTQLDVEVYNTWCRPSKTSLWMLELMIEDSRDDQWIFRRDARIFSSRS